MAMWPGPPTRYDGPRPDLHLRETPDPMTVARRERAARRYANMGGTQTPAEYRSARITEIAWAKQSAKAEHERQLAEAAERQAELDAWVAATFGTDDGPYEPDEADYYVPDLDESRAMAVEREIQRHRIQVTAEAKERQRAARRVNASRFAKLERGGSWGARNGPRLVVEDEATKNRKAQAKKRARRKARQEAERLEAERQAGASGLVLDTKAHSDTEVHTGTGTGMQTTPNVTGDG